VEVEAQDGGVAQDILPLRGLHDVFLDVLDVGMDVQHMHCNTRISKEAISKCHKGKASLGGGGVSGN
jgi:hypothetical protein